MYENYRVNTKINNGDTILRVPLQQDVNCFEVLSLKLYQEDTYQLHTSDYGVIVGRVLANNSFGVPNVKVSVFVEFDSEDAADSEIRSYYSFTSPVSTDSDGVRYNLLQNKEYEGFDNCHKAVGTFPNKRAVLDNDGEIEVFGKYWKYTTVTNQSGDYMIFGVPTGSTIVHYDCDLSDIGILSQRPYDFIYHGYDVNLFDSPTQFKAGDLNTLPQILSQNSSVYVYPFWGDENANEIGITRHDINLDYTFEPTCIFMGSSITDAEGAHVSPEGIANGDVGNFMSLRTCQGKIEIIRKTMFNTIEQLVINGNDNIDGNGVWCYQIPMNLDRIGMDEMGNIVKVSDPTKGIPTRASVRFRISLASIENNGSSAHPGKYLIPNNPPLAESVNPIRLNLEDGVELDDYYEFGSKTPDCCFADMYWGKVYSVKSYMPRLQYGINRGYQTSNKNSKVYLEDYQLLPKEYNRPYIAIHSTTPYADLNAFPYNTVYLGAEEMHSDYTDEWFRTKFIKQAETQTYPDRGIHFMFENDWINGCLYFPLMTIANNSDGSLNFFGSEEKYENIYQTGRHEWNHNSSGFHNPAYSTSIWDNDCRDVQVYNTTKFTHVTEPIGLLKGKTNNAGNTIFYYRPGGVASGGIYHTLYTTDLILLGNLCDIYDTLPQLFKNLPSTSATFPPVAPNRSMDEASLSRELYAVNDDEIETPLYDTEPKKALDSVCGNKSLEINKDTRAQKRFPEYELRYGILFGNSNINTKKCGGYFAGYTPCGFVNVSRLCELDVNNDMAIRTSFKPINVKGLRQNSVNTSYILPLNGVIDRFDISTNDNRAAFASMNIKPSTRVKNAVTGYYMYSPTFMYPVDFEGRLQQYIQKMNFNPINSDLDSSYIRFRFGRNKDDNPYYYTHNNFTTKVDSIKCGQMNVNLLLMRNSFYFFFGLRSGASALDVLRDKFYADCVNENSTKCNLFDVTEVKNVSCTNTNGSFKVTAYGQPPYAWYLAKDGEEYQSNSNDYSLTELNKVAESLPIGEYGLTITDKGGETCYKKVSITNAMLKLKYSSKGLNVNIASEIDEIKKYLNDIEGNKLNGYLTFESIDGEALTFSGQWKTGTTYTFANATAENGLRYNISVTPEFAKFENVELSGTHLTCSGSTINVSWPCILHVSIDSVNCNSTAEYTINIDNGSDYKLCINTIPVEKLNFTNIEKGIPGDSVDFFNYLSQDAFDSSSADEKLDIITNLSLSVFGGQAFNLTSEGGYINHEFALYPHFDEESETVEKYGTTNGVAPTDLEYCTNVGSTYMPSLNTVNMVRCPSGYTNWTIGSSTLTYNINENELLKKTSAYTKYCFAGVSKLNESETNTIVYSQPSGITSNYWITDGVINQKVDIDETPYYKLPTVDTRFDYDINLVVPSRKNGQLIYPGSINGYIYGGFALAFDTDTYEVILDKSKNPDKQEKNYEYYIDNNGLSASSYTKTRHWYDVDFSEDKGLDNELSHKSNITNNLDGYIPSLLIYTSKTGLSGITNLSISITGCSPTFNSEDRKVQPGDVLEINVSYEEPIQIYHKTDLLALVENENSDYNVLFEVSNSYTGYGTKINPVLNSLSVSFVEDSEYDGYTYTDLYRFTKSGCCEIYDSSKNYFNDKIGKISFKITQDALETSEQDVSYKEPSENCHFISKQYNAKYNKEQYDKYFQYYYLKFLADGLSQQEAKDKIAGMSMEYVPIDDSELPSNFYITSDEIVYESGKTMSSNNVLVFKTVRTYTEDSPTQLRQMYVTNRTNISLNGATYQNNKKDSPSIRIDTFTFTGDAYPISSYNCSFEYKELEDYKYGEKYEVTITMQFNTSDIKPGWSEASYCELSNGLRYKFLITQ